MFQRQTKEAHAIAHSACHVEERSRQSAIVSDTPAINYADFFIVQLKAGALPAYGRHRIGDQHRIAQTAQCEPQHRRRNVVAIDDEAVKTVSTFERGSDRAWFSALQPSHGIKEMREADGTFGQCRLSLLVGRHGVAKGDPNATRSES